jgi:hypothetical protein
MNYAAVQVLAYLAIGAMFAVTLATMGVVVRIQAILDGRRPWTPRIRWAAVSSVAGSASVAAVVIAAAFVADYAWWWPIMCAAAVAIVVQDVWLAGKVWRAR